MKKPKKRWVPAEKEIARDCALTVAEPAAPTEFEVQAYLWGGLRAAGINVRGEVKTRFAGRAGCRFDLAVFESGKLCGVLEVKKSQMTHQTTWEETRQGSRYVQFNVPVRVVYGMTDAEAIIALAQRGERYL